MVFTRFSGRCLQWPFCPQNLISTSTNPNTSVTKTGFFHSLMDRPDYRMPLAPFLNGDGKHKNFKWKCYCYYNSHFLLNKSIFYGNHPVPSHCQGVRRGKICPDWLERMRTHLEIASLWHQPTVDKLLWVLGKSEEEITIRLQLVDRLHRLVNL